jgi:hypothetical protein
MQPALRSSISDASLAVFAVNGGKPHQGFAGENPAPNRVREVCNSTVLLGMRGQAELNRIGSCCTGKERDSESGNDYFGARYYASTMGRFLSPDPAGCPIHSPASWRMGGKPRSHPARRVPLVPLIFPNQDAVNQQPSSPPLTPVTAITAIPFASTIPSSLRPWCVRSSFAKKSPHPKTRKGNQKNNSRKSRFRRERKSLICVHYQYTTHQILIRHFRFLWKTQAKIGTAFFPSSPHRLLTD